MKRKALSRRRFVAGSAAVSAAAISAPFVHTAHAAGKLSIGFWDHWVPGANDVSRAIAMEWAEKEKVDLQIDYITVQGNKNLLTIAAESQAPPANAINAWPMCAYSHKSTRDARNSRVEARASPRARVYPRTAEPLGR